MNPQLNIAEHLRASFVPLPDPSTLTPEQIQALFPNRLPALRDIVAFAHPSLCEYLLPLPGDSATAEEFALHFNPEALGEIAKYAAYRKPETPDEET